MTWSMPQSAAPTPPNQPTAPPGPLTLGDLFSSLFATYKAGWKLFLMLCLVPILLAFAAAVVIGVAAFAMLAPAIGSMIGTQTPNPSGLIGSIVGLSLLGVVVLIVVSLISYVYYSRIYIAAIDYATGREIPTGPSLAARTQGLMGRLVQLVLIYAGAVIALYLVMALVLVAILGASGGSPSGGAAFLIFVLWVAFIVGVVWVGIKVTYTLVVLAEERLSAMDAIRRSFALTKGAFWRTFGYLLVIGFAIGIVTSIPQAMLSSGVQSASGGGSSVMIFLGSLVLLALSFALMPVQNIWLGLMYVGRTREIANQAAGYPQSGYPGGAAWGAPATPFGQTPDQYGDQAGGRFTDPAQNATGGYGQPAADPYTQPGGYGQPGSSDPYGQQGGSTPYGQPGSSAPYTPPTSGQPGAASDPYAPPASYGQQTPSSDPYGQPGAASAPYGQSTPQNPYQPGAGAPDQQGEQGQRPEDQPPSDNGYYGRPTN